MQLCSVEMQYVSNRYPPAALPAAGEQFDTFTSDELTCIGRWICRFRHVPWP